MKKINTVEYPFFIGCMELCTDDYWKKIFENLSYGISVKGTYIVDGFIKSTKKGKEFSYRIEKKPSNLLYSDIYKLFTEKLGITSTNETTKKEIEYLKYLKKMRERYKNMDNSRKKSYREILLLDFVIRNMSSIKNGKKLLALITFGFLFNYLMSDNISYSENNLRIENIENLDITSESYGTIRTVEKKKKKFEKNYMADNWIKYCFIK